MKRKLGRVSVRISETGSAEVHQTCDEFPLREEQSLVATLSLASYFAAGGAAIGEGAASFLSAMGVVIAGSGFVTKRDALNPTGVVVRRIPEADPLEPWVASGRVPADRPVRRQDKTGSWIVGLVPVPPLRADVHVTDGSLEVEWPAYLGQQRGLENPLRLVAALWAYADYTADQGRECLLGLAELVRRCRTQPNYLWASDGVWHPLGLHPPVKNWLAGRSPRERPKSRPPRGPSLLLEVNQRNDFAPSFDYGETPAPPCGAAGVRVWAGSGWALRYGDLGELAARRAWVPTPAKSGGMRVKHWQPIGGEMTRPRKCQSIGRDIARRLVDAQNGDLRTLGIRGVTHRTVARPVGILKAKSLRARILYQRLLAQCRQKLDTRFCRESSNGQQEQGDGQVSLEVSPAK